MFYRYYIIEHKYTLQRQEGPQEVQTMAMYILLVHTNQESLKIKTKKKKRKEKKGPWNKHPDHCQVNYFVSSIAWTSIVVSLSAVSLSQWRGGTGDGPSTLQWLSQCNIVFKRAIACFYSSAKKTHHIVLVLTFLRLRAYVPIAWATKSVWRPRVMILIVQVLHFNPFLLKTFHGPHKWLITSLVKVARAF